MIIIYGGSFNPPTFAHYEIAKFLTAKYQPKSLIFVPVGNNYDKRSLIPFKFRFEMVEIIANQLKHASVSDFEDQNGFEGTIQTLNYFQTLYKDENLYYVIGADNLLSIDKWINYQTLLENFKFIVINRESLNVKNIINENNNLKKYEHRFIIEKEFKQIPVSASLYRDLNDDQVVLKEINDYIYRHQLYARGERV